MSIPGFRHHIVLVSAQNVAEYLAAAIPGSGAVCLHAIVSDKMLENSRALQKAWERHGGRYYAYRISSMDQHEIVAVLDSILDHCGKESIALNLTGGTKLMAFAAHDWAYAYDIPSFYVDTAENRIILLGREWHNASLPDIMDVKTLLWLYGYDMESSTDKGVAENLRKTGLDILKLVLTGESGLNALARLNACAARSYGTLGTTLLEKPSPLFADLLALCSEAGKIMLSGNELLFADEKAREWCNGIWLEEYVRGILWQMAHSGKIRSWASSVQVRRKGVRNELDALFTARNRLYVLECKSSRFFENHARQSPRASGVLYKADSLHGRLGGIYARTMICSVNTLAHNELERAKYLGIRIVTGTALLHLQDELVRWSNE